MKDLGFDWNPDGEAVLQISLQDVPNGADYRIRVTSARNAQYTDEVSFLLLSATDLKAEAAPESWVLYQ